MTAEFIRAYGVEGRVAESPANPGEGLAFEKNATENRARFITSLRLQLAEDSANQNDLPVAHRDSCRTADKAGGGSAFVCPKFRRSIRTTKIWEEEMRNHC